MWTWEVPAVVRDVWLNLPPLPKLLSSITEQLRKITCSFSIFLHYNFLYSFLVIVLGVYLCYVIFFVSFPLSLNSFFDVCRHSVTQYTKLLL